MKKRLTYKKAGVDILAAERSTSKIGSLARKTFNKNVLTDIGSFGGLFYFEKNRWKSPVLVSSTDGVGTKVMIASITGMMDKTGEDLVNHCVNDILVQGSIPLFFLDYIAFPKFSDEVVVKIISGISKACRENNCVLIGGETAEMPGVYNKGYYDLAGTIVGVVDKEKIVDGSKIRDGDVIIGLASSGLHTNGYSLARKIFLTGRDDKENRKILNRKIHGSKTLVDMLLVPHRSYLKPVQSLFNSNIPITGMAHITGGGFEGNVSRIIPSGFRAYINPSTWIPPYIFKLIQHKGNIDNKEMYRVFNMGIGFVIILKEEFKEKAISVLRDAGEKPVIIGFVDKHKGDGDVKMLW